MVFNCYNPHTILYCLLLVRMNLVHYTNDMRGQKVFCPSFMIIHEFNKKPAVSDKHDTAGFIIVTVQYLHSCEPQAH